MLLGAASGSDLAERFEGGGGGTVVIAQTVHVLAEIEDAALTDLLQVFTQRVLQLLL